MFRNVTLWAVPAIPEICPKDDLSVIICDALQSVDKTLVDGDIVVVAQKVVSKAEGQIIDLSTVSPSTEAIRVAKETGKDPRKVEVILQESISLVRTTKGTEQREGIIIAVHHSGQICANAGIDESNTGGTGVVVCLPRDADASARRLRRDLQEAFGVTLGVVVTDTFGRPWRMGQINVAIGLAGLPALQDITGSSDRNGRVLAVTQPAPGGRSCRRVGPVNGESRRLSGRNCQRITMVSSR